MAKDPVVAAKLLTDFAKENDQRPTVKGGLLDGKTLNAAHIKQLSTMPSREQMLAELGASMQAPIAAFGMAMNSLLTMFPLAVEALKKQGEETA
jgi:large subunit ribosomal protein L10